MNSKEALKIIKDNKGISFCEAYVEPLNAIEKDLDRLDKIEKVVKIIKDKLGLSIGLVHIEVLKEDDYFIKVEDDDMFLTKEEYNLLKEMLGND